MALVVVQITDALELCAVFPSGVSGQDQFEEMNRMRIENAPKGPDPAQWSSQARAARGASPQPQPLVVFVHEERSHRGSGALFLLSMLVICLTAVFVGYVMVRLGMILFG